VAEDLPPAVAVALLYDAAEGGASTREALLASGAAIVYEAASTGFDAAALADSGASVVLVDLHGSEDEVAGLDDLIDHFPVIINDAEVSSALSGWDRARWQRHLGAKVLGGGVDPPRPADAEPVPAPLRPAAAAPAVEYEGTTADEPAPAGLLAAEAASDSRADDGLATGSGLPAFEANGAESAGQAPPADDRATDLELPDYEAAVPVLSIDLPDAPAARGADALADFALEDWTPEVAGPAPAVTAADAVDDTPLEAARDEVPAIPDGDDWGLIDFDSLPEVPGFLPEASAPEEGAAAAPPGATEWDQLAAAADGLLHAEAERLETPTGTVEEADPAVHDGTVDDPGSARPLEAPEWSLEDIAEELPPPAQEFGIEKIEAAQFLAPTDDAPAGAAPAGSPGLALELIPLEEAVAPRQVSDEPLHEFRLEGASASPRIRQVWVLGASVGGPEAVREFLAALPGDVPALFLLAQHLGGEFVDIMARQLAQATPLTVRLPEHGDRLGHGEVIIVPAGRRLQLDPTGTVVLREAAADSAYAPSIDHLLEDLAEAFGAAAGVIIFSGMGEDAVEGCRRLAARGGKVWLQDPATCVVATMVEGVRQTGVASFIGSPVELAEHVQAAA
jgi:two-component system chemotaxis response regulator CheB/chemosensory pili system protein ChpB (putative protein-glutamate methylesterase)